MAATLKKIIGDSGAGSDKSHGTDRVYEVLVALSTDTAALVTKTNALIVDVGALATSLNQLIVDYNANTNIIDDTTAASVTVTATGTVATVVTVE